MVPQPAGNPTTAVPQELGGPAQVQGRPPRKQLVHVLVITLVVILVLMVAVAAIAYRLGSSRTTSRAAASPSPSASESPLPTQPTATATTETTETSAPFPSSPNDPTAGFTVMRTGRLTLTENYCVDLDSAAANWSVSHDCGTYGAVNGDGDIRAVDSDHGLYGPNGADFAVLDSNTNASFESCDAATDYSDSIGVKQVVAGLRFCVRTTAGNFALLQVVKATPTSTDAFQSATFSVTVWKPE